MERQGNWPARPPGGLIRLNPDRMRVVVAHLFGAIREAAGRRRLFILIPFGLIAGLLAYRLPTLEPDLRFVLAVGFVLGALTLISVAGSLHEYLLRGILILWCGFALLPVHGALFGTPMLKGSLYGDYSASVDEVLDTDGRAQRVFVTHIAADTDTNEPLPHRARLFVREGPKLKPGDKISATLRLSEVPGPVTPGGYDAQFHNYFAGVGAYGNTTTAPVIHESQPPPPISFDTTRTAISGRLEANMSQPALGIAKALTIGDQSLVSDEVRETMAAAGLAHVLAISGLHLTLVAGGVFAALRILLALSNRVVQYWPVKKLAALGGIFVALVYLGLSGASVSAIRATIMLVLVFGAVLAGRQALTMRNVAIAAICVLIIEPASLFRPSFQLSFAAVLALIGAYEMTRGGEGRERNLFQKLAVYVSGIATTSLIAGAATAMFAAYHFQQTAPLGVIGNILALPLVGFVVLPAGFFGVLMMPLGLEGPFLSTMAWAVEWILWMAGYVANWSAAISPQPLLNAMALLSILAGLAWFAFFEGRIRLAGPVIALPLALLLGMDPQPDVLIADRTQAIAARDHDRFGLMTGRIGSFATDVWSETYGIEIAQAHGTNHCDSLGCVATLPGGPRVALAQSRGSLAEDCRMADLVIARFSLPAACRTSTTAIDADALTEQGVHWLRWQPESRRWQVRRAITDPLRPWRPRNQGR